MITMILERLFELIETAGTTPSAVTKELGISISSFTDWKKGKGKPSIETLIKLADYFDVSLDWLVLGKEKPITLDLSNSSDASFLSKLHLLSPSLQDRLLVYMDGMLAAQASSEEAIKLSV